ncbi:MAG: ATP-binding protein [Endomicrobiia bacterium]
MSDLDKILEDQKLRLKRIRDRINNLTENIQMRKSGISAELFSASKDKMSEFSPSVFSEIQNLLLEEIAKGYEAIVNEKEKIIQQLQKDIENISLKYSQLDSTLKEQIAKVSVLSGEKDKTLIDLLKKTAEIKQETVQTKDTYEEGNKVFETEQKNQQKDIIRTNFNFSYQLVNEAARYFRTRKGVIEEALNIVKTELDNNPSCKKVSFAYEEVSKVIEIFSKLRDVLLLPDLKLQKVNLTSVIEDVLIQLMYDLKKQNVTITKEFSQNDLYVYVDKNIVVEILREILINSIESFVKPVGNQITLRLLKEKNFIKLIVVDNGCGIPEHLLSKVFNIFFTTKVNTNHFGLGLFKTYWYLKLLSADININSFFGKGTEVEITFYPEEGDK